MPGLVAARERFHQRNAEQPSHNGDHYHAPSDAPIVESYSEQGPSNTPLATLQEGLATIPNPTELELIQQTMGVSEKTLKRKVSQHRSKLYQDFLEQASQRDALNFAATDTTFRRWYQRKMEKGIEETMQGQDAFSVLQAKVKAYSTLQDAIVASAKAEDISRIEKKTTRSMQDKLRRSTQKYASLYEDDARARLQTPQEISDPTAFMETLALNHYLSKALGQSSNLDVTFPEPLEPSVGSYSTTETVVFTAPQRRRVGGTLYSPASNEATAPTPKPAESTSVYGLHNKRPGLERSVPHPRLTDADKVIAAGDKHNTLASRSVRLLKSASPF